MRSGWHEAQRNHHNRNQADRFEQHGISLKSLHSGSLADFFSRVISELAIYRNTSDICHILTVSLSVLTRPSSTTVYWETEMSDDTAGILAPPPLIFLGVLVLGLGFDARAPLG